MDWSLYYNILMSYVEKRFKMPKMVTCIESFNDNKKYYKCSICL